MRGRPLGVHLREVVKVALLLRLYFGSCLVGKKTIRSTVNEQAGISY